MKERGDDTHYTHTLEGCVKVFLLDVWVSEEVWGGVSFRRSYVMGGYILVLVFLVLINKQKALLPNREALNN